MISRGKFQDAVRRTGPSVAAVAAGIVLALCREEQADRGVYQH